MHVRRSFRVLLATLAGGFSALTPQAPRAGTPEYQVKARLLRLLAEYTTWPSGSATNDPKRAFVLGVIGQSPFEHHLESQFRDGPVKSKTPRVRYLSESDGVEDVDMLFICGSRAPQLQSILQRARGRSIFTVGDTTGYARHGVMVNFYLDGEHVKLEVNLKAAQAEQIAISSHVLKLARIVE